MIKTVKLKNFGRFGSYRLDLNGAVTAITGPNGSGKSTLLEALMYGVWGIQRRKLTRPGSAIQVLDERDEYILRTETDSSSNVSMNGRAKMTKTKAIEAISERYGAPSAWKNCLYINNKTVARFSQSRPAELKALIQDMLQSKELQQLRQQLMEHTRTGAALLTGHEQTSRLQKGRVTSSLGALTLAAKAWSTLQEQAAYKAAQAYKHDTLKAYNEHRGVYLQATERSKGASRDDIRAFYYDMRLLNPIQLRRDVEALMNEKLDSTLDGINCSSCGASIESGIRKARMAELKQRHARVRALDEAHKLYDHFTVGETHRRLRSEADAAEEAYRRAQAGVEHYNKTSERVPELFNTYCEELARAAIEEERRNAVANKQRVREDAIALCALAQTTQLQRVMQRVALYANSYLAAISAQFSVEMDNTGIIVKSDKGTQDYESLSAGEARRVDVCLCLAAAMVSAEVGSLPLDAPVIIDEAFDTLDTAGIESILNLLYEVAKTRQVVLVTHADVTFAVSGQLTHIRLGA